MDISGRLVLFPVADLLNWASNERRTGSLVVRRSSREKRIYFKEGKTVACLSDTTSEFYGRHLLLEGYVAQDALVRCLVKVQGTHRRIGPVLVEEGVLDREVVRRTLKEHIEDMVCDVFLWKRGIFFFQADLPPEEDILAAPINTLGLILEGSRWVDELRQFREVLPHDHVLVELCRDPGESLNQRAAFIVRELDRQRTVASLYASVGGSYFRFLAETVALAERGLLKVTDRGRSYPTGSIDLSIAELMMEQAAEEQILSVAHDLAVPLHLLESYYPARSREPDVEDRLGVSELEKAFLERIDGNRPLREILGSTRAERTNDLELLLLLISKGLLALIPPPVQEIGD